MNVNKTVLASTVSFLSAIVLMLILQFAVLDSSAQVVEPSITVQPTLEAAPIPTPSAELIDEALHMGCMTGVASYLYYDGAVNAFEPEVTETLSLFCDDTVELIHQTFGDAG